MTRSTTVVVPTVNGVGRIDALLRSLEDDGQVIVVDNGSVDGTRRLVEDRFPDVDILALPENRGFSRAVNEAAALAEGDVLVLLNDDCICEPGFVARIADAVDASAGVVMAAGIMLEAADPACIDSAGIELDATLLVFDYLNGRPVEAAERALPPVGPSGAAGAFDRQAFLDAGGFDEALFAYWEDVDLALRLRLAGATCALVPSARCVHTHSATLGSGSARKNYLTGFGRGYTLRRWSVASPRRVPAVLTRELAISAAQLVVDRTVSGVVGRVRGWRAAAGARRYPYPEGPFAATPLPTQLARRRRRRARVAL